MKFAAIIPDRNDRPQLTAQCFKMLDRMTLKPDKIYHVNYEPFTNGFDLIPRIKSGIDQATKDGIDLCFVIENDDSYPTYYFERFANFFNDFDFFGEEKTYYYNINTLRWSLFLHKHRASLFTTGFKISALNNFEWPQDSFPFLDIELWKYARHKRRKFVATGAIGIKHGQGKCGGKGHFMKLHNDDSDMSFLKSRIDEKSLEFYSQMAGKLITV